MKIDPFWHHALFNDFKPRSASPLIMCLIDLSKTTIRIYFNYIIINKLTLCVRRRKAAKFFVWEKTHRNSIWYNYVLIAHIEIA